MKKLDRDAARRRIAELPEDKVSKVLAFMEELQRAEPLRARTGRSRPHMGRIALRGLAGRRRDTILLWTVIALAFLFLALPTTIITSLEATDAAQRMQTYGKWQVMASGLSSQRTEDLARQGEDAAVTPLVEVSGADFFQGDNTYTLGVYSPELADLGSFQLREGRWPEAADEVVVEYARLASLGLEVGDSFTIQTQTALPMAAEHAAANQRAYAEAREEQKERMTELFYSDRWEYVRDFVSDYYSGEVLLLENGYAPLDAAYSYWNSVLRDLDFQQSIGFLYYWGNSYKDLSGLFRDWRNPEESPGAVIPLDELTDEEFQIALDYYLDNVYMPFYAETFAQNGGDLLGVGGISVRVNCTGGLGAADPLEMSAIVKYTICGVIDTYTDRWDNGNRDLPSGFMTEEAFQRLRDCQEAVLEKYPNFQAVDYESMALLRSAGDASALWEDTLGDYNQGILEQMGFTRPFYRLRYVNPVLDENGWPQSYEKVCSQLTFDFYLGDPARPRWDEAKYVENAWLIPASCQGLVGEARWVSGEEYVYDRPLADGLEASGDQMIAFRNGRLNQLTEVSEDLVVLINEYEVYDAETGEYLPASVSTTLAMDLDGAVVAFDLDGQRHEIPLADFAAGNFSVGGMVPIDLQNGGMWLENLGIQDNFTKLRVNTFAYPASAEGTGSLLLLVMGLLFVTTVCAVFQICFTQMRRRMRRIVLMKSLGAEGRQIAAIMGWEFLYFWITALPAGTALGLGGARLAVSALSGAQEREILLTVSPAVLLTALAAGTLALAAGMAIPALMAVGVPLTGRTVRRTPPPPPKREVRQDFFHISLRGLAAKKVRTAGVFALCAFMMTITVLCLFLGFRFLGEYRDTVVRDGKPDYHLRAPYAMGLFQRETYLEELEELGICEEVTSYFVGEDVHLDGQGLEESFLFTIAAGDGASVPVDLYTLTSEDALFGQFQDAATVGSLDPDAFDSGEQVLLAVPLYRDTGKVNEAALEAAHGWDRLAASGIETTFLPEYDGIFLRDGAVQAGDTILLENATASVQSESYVTSRNSAGVTVGAVLYYFPDTGLWPISGSGEGYQVVASPALLKTLLPSSGHVLNHQAVRAIYLRQKNMQAVNGTYGATDFYIRLKEGAAREAADTDLLVFARNHYMEIDVYRASSEKLLRDAVSNILLSCLLGMSAVMLALVIFYNTVSSDIEQERPRIGILQALGVPNRLFALRQAAVGAAASGAALAAGNILLWGGVAIFANATGAVLRNLLWGYPAPGHMAACLALAGVIIFLFVLPIWGLRKYLPVENIRTNR